MALAIKFQDMIDRGEIRDFAEIARLGYVTRGRMTQIMSLLNLAPDMQEHLLFLPLPSTAKGPASERNLREIASMAEWDRQREKWGSGLPDPPSAAHSPHL
jgi:hypothetical protein